MEINSLHHIEERLQRIEATLELLRPVLLAINARTMRLVRAEVVELKAESKELHELHELTHPAADALNLSLAGIFEKPPAQILVAHGVEGGRVMAPATLPPDLEKRLAVVGDPMFQRFTQTACDHGIDPGEHPVKQAARVILSLCCVSNPYALAEPEPAQRLNALLDRFRLWSEANG